MTEYILGRECEQPFVIPQSATAVSRQPSACSRHD